MSYSFSRDFLIEVSKGKVPGHAIVRKFGEGIVSTTPRNIWDGAAQQGLYQYPTVADTFYLSSTSTEDNTPVEVEFLTDAGNRVVLTQMLQGQTQVAFPTQGVRFNRAQHKPSGGAWAGASKALGDIYISNALGVSNGEPNDPANIVLKITQGKEQTQHGLYTVPEGFTGFMLRFSISTESNKVLSAIWNIRDFGSSFKDKGEFSDIGNISRKFEVFDQIPSKSDIEFLAQIGTSTAEASVSFDMLLINNNLVTPLSFDPTDIPA